MSLENTHLKSLNLVYMLMLHSDTKDQLFRTTEPRPAEPEQNGWNKSFRRKTPLLSFCVNNFFYRPSDLLSPAEPKITPPKNSSGSGSSTVSVFFADNATVPCSPGLVLFFFFNQMCPPANGGVLISIPRVHPAAPPAALVLS